MVAGSKYIIDALFVGVGFLPIKSLLPPALIVRAVVLDHRELAHRRGVMVGLGRSKLVRLHFVEGSAHSGQLVGFRDGRVARCAFRGVCIGRTCRGGLMRKGFRSLRVITRGESAEGCGPAKKTSQSMIHKK